MVIVSTWANVLPMLYNISDSFTQHKLFFPQMSIGLKLRNYAVSCGELKMFIQEVETNPICIREPLTVFRRK